MTVSKCLAAGSVLIIGLANPLCSQSSEIQRSVSLKNDFDVKRSRIAKGDQFEVAQSEKTIDQKVKRLKQQIQEIESRMKLLERKTQNTNRSKPTPMIDAEGMNEATRRLHEELRIRDAIDRSSSK